MTTMSFSLPRPREFAQMSKTFLQCPSHFCRTQQESRRPFISSCKQLQVNSQYPRQSCPALQQQYARQASHKDVCSDTWCNIPRCLSPEHARMAGALAMALALLGQLSATSSLLQAMTSVLGPHRNAVDSTGHDESLGTVFTAHIIKVGMLK